MRLLLGFAICIVTVLLLSYIASSRSAHVAGTASGRIHALFDWRSPSSLFPPSAIISLTDDNSTFFLARPANFGPLLPSGGLSGQLWVGSGFGDDALGHGGVASAEGELGCSDVPGWDPSDRGLPSMRNGDAADRKSKAQPDHPDESHQKMSSIRKRSTTDIHPKNIKPSNPTQQDGTDDHLHHPLPSSEDPKAKAINGKKPGHADIQSIQESAEIAGRVVLLRRGGCGFLEKVKWVQRRGGTALIVGDNERGGTLVTMYARGDTSNVTIPSLFTSYTTAQLLSSLMPSGGRRDDIGLADAKRLGLALGPDSQLQTEPNPKTPSSRSKDYTKVVGGTALNKNRKRGQSGWLRSLFPSLAARRSNTAKSNGRLASHDQSARPTKHHTPLKGSKNPGDGFVIGVHDWRDPDLFEFGKPLEEQTRESSVGQSDKHTSDHVALKSSTTTPGSGEYNGQVDAPAKHFSAITNNHKPPLDRNTKSMDAGTSPSRGSDSGTQDERSKEKLVSTSAVEFAKPQTPKIDSKKPHEGLWVTLQPTTMSTSPFFDTLLVLVVSPLVTLTVVYALLLLRSRIRRRRWRAPKSVVERLPVRTYHTIASSTATTNSSRASPPGTPPTVDQTTPLLHSCARPIGQRPRSRTAGEVPVASSSFANRTSANMSLDQIQEKREAGLMEWRRKYGGRQRECVVCLEEYVDGVSRVMSLPCGHEFHAECMCVSTALHTKPHEY